MYTDLRNVCGYYSVWDKKITDELKIFWGGDFFF